jgi:hypothetical protein
VNIVDGWHIRKSKNLPDAWWGRFVETVETERGPVRVQRNVRLGEARLDDIRLLMAAGEN